MTTAFVLSGGGSLGAVQVGMLQALAARGVGPDLVIGTSAAAAVGRVPSLCPNDALRQLVEQHLGFARLEDAA